MGFIINPYNFAAAGFQDNFSSSANWTITGTQVTITGGEVVTTGASGSGAENNHAWASLGLTLNSADTWKMSFDFYLTSHSGDEAHHKPIHVHATQSSGNPHGTIDTGAIGFGVSSKGGACFINYKLSASPDWQYPTQTQIDLAPATQYYIDVEKTADTTVVLRVFSNVGRTTHITTSPQTITIPSGITGLNNICIASTDYSTGGFDVAYKIDNLSVAEV